jgi:hypothetical protein
VVRSSRDRNVRVWFSREHFNNLLSISCNKNMVYTVGQNRTLVATFLSSFRLVL